MTNIKHRYLQDLAFLIAKIDKEQSENIDKAAVIVADTLETGGIIHTFGAGHSASVALEGFHRSGSFVQVNAVLDPVLMFHSGAVRATETERKEGYMLDILKTHSFQPQDCMIIVSNSGRNPAGIDAALYAKERGVKVIVITAYQAQKSSKSRHSSGKKLSDIADVIIDNLAGKDEANLSLFEGKKFGPVSTVSGAAIINAVYFTAAEKLLKKGHKPEIYTSSNAGGDEENAKYEKKYASRIKHLNS
ncbi:uncharacterized protein containing SIS (Sugar isomerase) phosphosugar binding domain [Elusimicrobium minutum Pei191]|uniref:Uncharacterized protein containing SIS (Sugar isomerase) phosphosugar binding domain n=1 Tax=Elusimicrobium minutum (strain Pei191) TaxID=445932 RepID=B2KCV7_ELUMP|nr:SIS domain-containing protein [Elusimicrobium minutum]ACC98353.1 uncharacterized protein containing SIS (Sugar isomerase) phosphosugar binding domain [Elusimicrobium minutum Pei191]